MNADKCLRVVILVQPLYTFFAVFLVQHFCVQIPPQGDEDVFPSVEGDGDDVADDVSSGNKNNDQGSEEPDEERPDQSGDATEGNPGSSEKREEVSQFWFCFLRVISVFPK